MELDDIKTLMNGALEQEMELRSSASLQDMLGKQTQSVIQRIKRSIWFELSAFILFALGAVACWLLYHRLLVHLFCMATWVLCIAFSAYLLLLHRRINFYEQFPAPVKENIQQVIDIVTRFTKLYAAISLGMLPVIYCFGLLIGYVELSSNGLLQQFAWSEGMLYAGIAFIVGWSVFIFFISKWYIRKLYGHYLLQLQQQLKDIENG
ncbi:MAG TPA: hypothetical protein VL307_13565 [Chitinophagaceae bacterium]|nr:hypothetical protein [Chitinophagaceae bacterium]